MTGELSTGNLVCIKINDNCFNNFFQCLCTRYKVVVSVTIVEKKDAGMFMSFEHLFDATKDRYSTFVYENPSLCGAGVISAFYYD